MKLYFLRHGLAGEPSEWRGNDFDRPLTDEGKERMTRQAATIATLDLELDAVLTSPLMRAYQTAEIVARQLKLLGKLVKDERLGPGFNTQQLAKILAAHPKANALMLVGHEPGLSETIGDLIGGGRVVCKKGSLIRVDVNAETLRGELVWSLPPGFLVR